MDSTQKADCLGLQECSFEFNSDRSNPVCLCNMQPYKDRAMASANNKQRYLTVERRVKINDRRCRCSWREELLCPFKIFHIR